MAGNGKGIETAPHKIPENYELSLSTMAPHRKPRSKADFECSICKSTFSSKEGLRRHASIHNGEKPYECTYCDARFRVSYSLTLHIRTHTGEKPYECDLCGATFTQRPNLNTHLKAHAKRERESIKPRGVNRKQSGTYSDSSVSVVLAAESELAVKCAEPQEFWKCDFCSSGFSHQELLTHHMNDVHTFEAFVQHEREEVAARISKTSQSGSESPQDSVVAATPVQYESDLGRSSFSSVSLQRENAAVDQQRFTPPQNLQNIQYNNSPQFHYVHYQQYPSVYRIQPVDDRGFEPKVKLPPISSLFGPDFLSSCRNP